MLDIQMPVVVVVAQPAIHPRPALMTSKCNGFNPNPAYDPETEGAEPMLCHCQNEATRRLVLQTDDDVYTLLLCGRHAQVQRRDAARNGWDVLDDQPMGATR